MGFENIPIESVILAGLLLLSLVLYFVLGGADFGGGIWDLCATGPRKQAQRVFIQKALGPVWEANHVWLVFAIVILFSAFPAAFRLISIMLHVLLSLFVLGVVFRGSAFAFRSAQTGQDQVRSVWGRIFAWASLLAPFFLGMCVGAIADANQDPVRPFSIVIGLFALVLCAYVAATFLCYETRGSELENDFRRRALVSGIACGIVAALGILLARSGAPLIFAGLTGRPSAGLLHLLTAVVAIGALFCCYTRRYTLARVAVIAQVTLILCGWAFSQWPFLVVPFVKVGDSGNLATQRALLWATAIGAPIVIPSLYLLFKIFKSRPT
jgi:cytochrome d ubiquinol oxidase subunit II